MAWLEKLSKRILQKVRESRWKTGDWYEVYRLPGNVYAICEPQHFQEVNIYLIIGEKRAWPRHRRRLLSAEAADRRALQREIFAVNSHFHFDHIGYNYCFSRCTFTTIHMQSGGRKRLPKKHWASD